MPICQTHTLVIGAGPSGLAAAYRLAQAGAKPVIVERSSQFGGPPWPVHRRSQPQGAVRPHP
jgi:cation diffusion facilitator CzcD-associated flavoprotein CzcO